MTPIRPNAFPPVQTPAAAGADAARAAAQKAFFDAAMGRTAAPAPAPTAQAAAPAQAARPSIFAALTPTPQRAEVRPDPAAEAPAKILRPGSLLDIRV